MERYAEAAQILGRGDETIQLLRRAFDTRLDAGEVDRAITARGPVEVAPTSSPRAPSCRMISLLVHRASGKRYAIGAIF